MEVMVYPSNVAVAMPGTWLPKSVPYHTMEQQQTFYFNLRISLHQNIVDIASKQSACANLNSPASQLWSAIHAVAVPPFSVVDSQGAPCLWQQTNWPINLLLPVTWPVTHLKRFHGDRLLRMNRIKIFHCFSQKKIIYEMDHLLRGNIHLFSLKFKHCMSSMKLVIPGV